ncbi:MAG: transcription termination/antitermination protein NusA [Candidatus Colwellbacteria bacterium CG10_big_fil_rev_8_21_14_0_10_41_28]|uniref:Transcription termination/antitermination protein NusA n=1 Tax=Candidatus Colwellbacteria bacterium CG10_big_fil_rev_8_21_14_0_10_41_28 TaxID=1974539 RepID=A0A2H0VJC7_9BACT|nr:MAG: transcription termination/antitermination protein NusA [Candidatus Colwellbacteria bacterium CG10_big_fil_rev_8_21_14_0_10_41_28]
MMDLKTVIQAVNQIAEDKGIDASKVMEAIENSLAAAYRREFLSRSANVKADLNQRTGEVTFYRVKEAVDESTVRMIEEGENAEEETQGEDDEGKLPRYNPERHILIEEARKDNKDVELGDEIKTSLPAEMDFGRIAAQNAKQVILQHLREAERDSITDEYVDKEGKIVSGVIQRFERGNVYIDLGRTNGVMFSAESIPGEHYRVGERLRFYILAVQREFRGPGTGIILSRAHPEFVKELFAMEIPEISDGIVEIKGIVREPGSRTKIAVHSNTEEIDPVGSCVGQRGTRIMAISNELGQEKIDVIEWSDDPEELVAHALSPAKVRTVEAMNDNEMMVMVSDDQLSLAIGRGGQNVRLAARLTGWRIDVRSQSNPDEKVDEGMAEVVVEEESSDDTVEESPQEDKQTVKEKVSEEEVLEEKSSEEIEDKEEGDYDEDNVEEDTKEDKKE